MSFPQEQRMSQSPEDWFHNPYAVSSSSPPPRRPAAAAGKRPTFCTVLFIMDLLFCIMRVPLVLFGIFAAFMLYSGNAHFPFPEELVWWDVGTGVGVITFGLLANVLLLMNKSSGLTFGWLAVVAAVASTIVGATQQFSFTGDALMPAGDVGRIIGVVIGLIVRLGFNVMFALAMLKSEAWQASRAA
jgi:hypothetical protein